MPSQTHLSAAPLRYRPANSIVTWLLAGVVAALSIAGTGLHSILGIHHGLDCCGSAHHASAVGGPQLATVDRAHAGDDSLCDETTCPVCNYLAQAQLAGRYAAIVVCSLSVDNDNVALRSSVPAADFPVFDARGPPAV